ncbi:hypothetical protein [Methylobacterium aerolatum]|uniref:Uncharacterized protein n=1 Tax=Methylobacterium aerolatum TaxID=418708 RepID=A0ABU0HW20_9HYPH|nr:hypothetical protein [Methylobacterium aerolatum]MDQ0446023.1 hypothetical protein [Methylobacterium aerolatum]GJD35060.1 hypothetical protein FMGBMHLM_1967 [Methylobacterium aerolatum]
MTKTAALLGATALLFATAAVAQPAPPPPDAPRGGPEAAPPPPPPGGRRAGPDGGPPPPPGGPRRGPDGPPPPPPPSKAAHFRFERGDARIDVKCADDESMKTCADLTLQLLDKLSTLKPSDAR